MQPLNSNEWRVMGMALKQIFGNGRTVVLAAAVAIAMFLAIVWLGNIGLVWQVVTSGSVSIADKVKILVALTGSIATNFSIFSALSSIAIALLFGANIALLFNNFRLRQAFSSRGESVVSLGGLASGLLGVGCAACGSFALAPALSFLGAGTFVSLLPFGGAEFSLMGIALLSWALVLSLRKVTRLTDCQVPSESGQRVAKPQNRVLQKPINLTQGEVK